MSSFIAATPLRTAMFLLCYSVVAAMAVLLAHILLELLWWDGVPAAIWCGVVLSLTAGLPIRVTVEPVRWRRLCRARNVATCVVLVFGLMDVVLMVLVSKELSDLMASRG